MSAPLPGRTLADLDGDALAHCARHLCARDVASLAMACRPLHAAAYCDAVWYRLYREQWPFQQVPRGALGIRELYIRRHNEVHQMKFNDPLSSIYHLDPTESAPSHLMLDRNDVWFSQGPVAKRLSLGWLNMELMETYKSHSARITCMRLFPLIDTPLFRSDTHTNEKALVTSSTDRTVRLCWKIVAPKFNADIVITGDDNDEISRLKMRLSREFEVKDLGQLKYFLGIEIARSPKGIVISQRKYVFGHIHGKHK